MNKIPWFDMDDPAVKYYLDCSKHSMVVKIIKRAERKIKKQKSKYGSSLLEDGLTKFGLMVNGKCIESIFKKLLGAKREELLSISCFKEYAEGQTNHHDYDDAKEGFGYLFDYDTIINKYKINGRKYRSELLKALDTTICPYCDRTYITYRDNGNDSRYSGQLDHYYPKASYPLFAMSLFNFVPCCASCNHTKSNPELLTLYPYEESADGVMSFISTPKGDYQTDEYEQNLTDLLLGRRKANISLTLEVNTSDAELEKRLNNSKSVFELESLYQSHCNLVSELYLRKRIYDEGSFLNSLKSLSTRLGLSTVSESELEAFLYGYQWDGEGFYHDRPLAKLTGDLLKQIKSQDKNS